MTLLERYLACPEDPLATVEEISRALAIAQAVEEVAPMYSNHLAAVYARADELLGERK